MIDVVLSYLDTNANVWNRVPMACKFKNKLTEASRSIELSTTNQQNAQVYAGKTKAAQKKVTAEKADIVNDAVECFASVTGNAELEARMAKSASDLYRLPAEEFSLLAAEVVKEAENNKEVLTGEYGLPEEMINDLKAELDAFNELRGAPRMYSVASVQATSSLDDQFAGTLDILDKLDKVMKMFKRSNTNFYNGYLSARTIVD